jgi:DNA-binding transcriptional ArsR family regulator
MSKRRDVGNRSGDIAIAPVEMPGLDSHLCFALYAASNHMTRLFVPFLKKLGVTYPQYLVLVVLWERGAQGVGELASALQMDLGSLSPMLKRLEAKGLVTRRRQAEDERCVLVDRPNVQGHIASQADRTDAGRILLLPEYASG